MEEREKGYVKWQEMNVSSDKGRREVRYYLKRKIDGGLDLAVVGKERNLRHMSYYFVNKFNNDYNYRFLKLKSRREVIDWLDSVVSDGKALESLHQLGSLTNTDASELDIINFKGTQLQMLGQNTREFLWLGSPWTCRKRRKHYQSFRRNGVRISVYEFVHVLAEEDKRLVAYLEDMYEDSKGNKMVVVRWYHKIDEVGIALPYNYNDREIFSSLFLQDLSIECIDGMVTVLSPQHFEKFRKEAKQNMLDSFVCSKQFDNDDIRPFDITQVKGYWKQEIFRYMYTVSSVKDQANSQVIDHALRLETSANHESEIRPLKRLRRLRDDMYAGSKQMTDTMDLDTHDLNNSLVDRKCPTETCSLIRGESTVPLSTTDGKENPLQFLKVGAEVEVLSQDSGIRGCWFRALIIKMRKCKVKVRYQDIKDADNEANNLEEWILVTRVAIADILGFRVCGRPIIRPPPPPPPLPTVVKGRVSWGFDVGSAVDVWRHDVWQEGIIVRKESEDQFHVYFPGEKQESVFGCSDFRHSQEWSGNGWTHINDRADIVTAILSCSEKKIVEPYKNKSVQAAICDAQQSEKSKTEYSDKSSDSGSDTGGELKVVRDLSKDDCLAQLKWNSSKKRRRNSGISSLRMHNKSNGSKSSTSFRFILPISLKVDRENCKFMGDSLFNSAVTQPLTSLVMSR